LLIYRRTACPCVVSPSRSEAVASLLDEFEVDVVISDDGLQHYALGRDMEIAVVDARRLVGNGFCLPAGPLREPPQRLESVDYVLHRGGSDPLSGVNYRQAGLVNTVSGVQRPLAPAVVGQQVHAVAGIGQPQQFFQSLEDAGYSLETHAFPDHHLYTPGDFAQLGDKPVIMTEKDAVKCRDFAGQYSWGQDAWYLKIEAQLPAAVCEAVADLARR
jgi:tetraacyldisaccharide 4'-kinase